MRRAASTAAAAAAQLRDFLPPFFPEIPARLVAQAPAVPRESARLCVLRRAAQTVEHRYVRDLPAVLADERWTMVVNDSRVVRCRLSARCNAGAPHVIYLLERADASDAPASSAAGTWRVSGDSIGAMARGSTLTVDDGSAAPLLATLTSHVDDGSADALVEIRTADGSADVASAIDSRATVPLPPYMKWTEESSAEYNTCYAREDGSVAAPTAGLHFTPDLLAQLRAAGAELETVTLHVGYGTFGAVRADNLDEHAMHAERCIVAPDVARRLAAARASGRRILAVGTTATRTLESRARPGGRFAAGEASTDLFIREPYEFRAVDALLTNLHVPGLTPLVLTCALAGRPLVMRAYAEAVEREYRFFSFGDAMLILP